MYLNRNGVIGLNISAMICTYCNYARILLQFTVSECYGMCTARRECDIAIITGDNSQRNKNYRCRLL